MKGVSRIILGLMLAGAFYVLIWGPRPEPALPADWPKDTLVLNYWEKWVGPEEIAMRQIVDGFNQSVGKDKHVYIQMMSMSNIDQKTLVATAAGVPPDIAGLWEPTLVQFGALGALEPLEDLAESAGINESYYKAVYWRACHYNGHLYGLVSTPSAIALFYNKRIFHESADVLRKAGLDPDRPPATLQELDEYANALNVLETDSGGHTHLVRAGYLPMPPDWDWHVTDMPIWFGGSIWDLKARRFTLTDEPVLKSLEWLQSFPKRLGVRVTNEFTTSQGGFNTMQNPFIAGTLVMEQQGPFMANFIHQLKPSMDHDWAAAPFPSAVPGLKDVTYCDSDMLVIPKGCRHIPEAFEFLKYVNRTDVSDKLCSLHCKNSPLANPGEDFIRNHPNPYISVFEELSSSPNAHEMIQTPVALEAGAELKAVIEGVLTLKRDPAEALAAAQETLQAKYDEYARKQQLRGIGQ